MKMRVWLLELFAGHLPPSATPLDSRFRWNDEMSGGSLSRIGVRDMLS